MIRASAHLLCLFACGLLQMACQSAATPAPQKVDVTSPVLPSITSVLETQSIYFVFDDN